ncbi:MAG: sodium:proton antiporter [bacterium]
MHSTLEIPWLLVLPFAGMLLAIALLPLTVPHFWEKNWKKGLVAGALALPVLAFFARHGAWAPLGHTLEEYLSFLALLGSLFVVSGGVVLRGDLEPRPRNNTLILALGAVLANLIGTTGASMLLIRPLLRTNARRRHTLHIPIFFIFLVSNAGGLLTPLGDPPLFLGFLRGVPFTWTLKLFPIWTLVVGTLLAAFYLWDRLAFAKEVHPESLEAIPGTGTLKVMGKINFWFLLGIIGAVYLPTPWRESAMVAMALASWLFTPHLLRVENSFTFSPIVEVAVLFAGIFVTMCPALILLAEHGREFGLQHPAQFFWVTGALSSFLDNAPTYLTFFSIAQGLHGGGSLVAGVPEHLLLAISAGAVLMGANSYIGNGPNFMVKAIADEAHFKTPNFFAYIGYALMILGPLYLAITWIFF